MHLLKRLSIFCSIILLGLCWKNGPREYIFPELKFFPPVPGTHDNRISIEGVELGRYLFYDSILSKNMQMSCGSCHRQEAAFSDGPNRFSKGKAGFLMPRNTPPLFNLAWNRAFFWDGRAASIEEQALEPVRAHNEMDLSWPEATKRLNNSKFYKSKFKAAFETDKIDSTLISKAIGQFVRTLVSYRSKFDHVIRKEARFTKDEYRGYVLVNDMTKGDCLHCHTTDGDVLGTTGDFSNNGLDAVNDPSQYKDKGRGGVNGKNKDLGKFKIPSLRNVALTAPYMHDGRFKTLNEVVEFYDKGLKMCTNIDPKMEFAYRGGMHLSQIEKSQILAFLQTLTDSAFINDPAFSNPFKKM